MSLFKFLNNAVDNSKKKKGRLFSGGLDEDTENGFVAEPASPQNSAPQSIEPDGNYGVAAPKKHSKLFNTLRDILAVAAPAITSASQGTGLIPGAAIGALGMFGGRARQDEGAQDQFNKDRLFRQTDRKIDTDASLANAELSALTGYRNQSLALDADKVVADRNKQKTDASDNFRKEYFGNQIVKDTEDATTGIKKIREASKSFNKSGSGFDDMALIFNYMKVLDPGSTVREGEYATASKNASMLDRMGVSWEKVKSGEQLSPQQRKNLVEAAERQYKGTYDAHESYKGQMKSLAEKRGIDPSDVFMDFGQGPDAAKDEYHLSDIEAKMRQRGLLK